MEVQRWNSGHAHLKVSWIRHQKDGISPSPVHSLDGFGSNYHRESRISPAVLFIIVILAVLFFISGLLHLLIRFLMKNPSSSHESNRNMDESTSDALERQLQQLFNLHDSGLDQAFIDALPVFQYKEIEGPKEPLDCAVCLCEFTEADQLRLLPICSHAFHISCIDTWLLSNSSCPLCRGTLFNAGFPMENPIFDYQESREEDGCQNHTDNGLSVFQKRVEIEEIVRGKGVFPVRLGKFRKVDKAVVGEEEGSSSSRLDARRCYSMGSYQYIVGDTNLRVALSSNTARKSPRLCTIQTLESGDPSLDGGNTGKKISIGTKTDSYSVSKIWLWSKKGKYASRSNETTDDDLTSPKLDLTWMHKAAEV